MRALNVGEIDTCLPFFFRLYQNAKDPFFGNITLPRIGNAVPPPSSTSES
jgi:hypothetical protein